MISTFPLNLLNHLLWTGPKVYVPPTSYGDFKFAFNAYLSLS